MSELEENHLKTKKRENHHLFELSGRNIEYIKIANLLKFSLMVSSVVSFVVVLHADVQSEHYESFLVQAGVSGSFFPSIFRVTSMFIKLSPLIDVTVLMLITCHLIVAGVSLYLIISEQTSLVSQVPLVSAAAFILLSVLICVAEGFDLLLALTQALQVGSSAETSEEDVQQVEKEVKTNVNRMKSEPTASVTPNWVYQN